MVRRPPTDWGPRVPHRGVHGLLGKASMGRAPRPQSMKEGGPGLTQR